MSVRIEVELPFKRKKKKRKNRSGVKLDKVDKHWEDKRETEAQTEKHRKRAIVPSNIGVSLLMDEIYI